MSHRSNNTEVEDNEGEHKKKVKGGKKSQRKKQVKKW